jgi:hypothetical protein
MSIKTRLLVLMILLVTVIVTILSALHLNSLVQNWTVSVMQRSELVAQQVKSLVLTRIGEQSEQVSPPPADLYASKELWTRIVAQDKHLEQLIQNTMVHAQMIVEIVVADELGEILICSTPARKGKILRKLPAFSEWTGKEVTDRLLELARGHQDYEVTLPLGVPQQRVPIFTIQIVVSSAYLRNAILPQVRTLGFVFGFSLLMSILLGVFSANLAIGPLASISKEIDRIAKGGEAGEEKERDSLGKTRELAIVQSKLNLLGQQIRGAQEDVTQMRSNIETLMERMEDAVLLFDRNERLIMAGPAVERLLDIPRHMMLGMTLEEVFPPAGPLGSVIQQAVRMGSSPRDYLVTMERDDEQPIRLLVNIQTLAEGNGTLITLRDAESRVQLATQLDISRRLAAISRLTGGVAHEIKNPLNSISLRLELLRARLEQTSPEALEEIGVITQEIRRLDRVVKTFLDFTRPVDLAVEDVDLAALTREVTSLVKPQAALQSVSIECAAEPEAIPIRGDHDLLKQAILNVVMNGIEAMKAGGTLSVRVHQNADYSVLTVEDQGPGIPYENQGKVFQLYFTTKEKGSGIGLAMTFRAVQLHNGTIDFTSEAGKGTTFRLRFPLAAQTS